MKQPALFILSLFFLSVLACDSPKTVDIQTPSESIIELTKGIWRGALNISKTDEPLEIPFNFEIVSNEKIIIHNGEEQIEVTDIALNDQAISIKMPVFGSELILTQKDNKLEGAWHNYNKKDYQLPFTATQMDSRFVADKANATTTPLAQRWKVTFSPNTDHSYPAIGIFNLEENSNKATGTFLTETGDYRYLEGIYDGKMLHLSCFDGAHAFLFKAEIQEDGTLKGDFWSGNHWHEAWEAAPSDDFELTKMDELTYLKEGYDKIEFEFPNAAGEMVSLADERFQGKATIVQVTGSWCPNCMDETRFFVKLYNKYHSEGLEIIAIDYESSAEMEAFKKGEERIRKDLKVDYPIVFGGWYKKDEAAKTLPMLNHIMSYPTAIFIDKTGKVRSIHTGFSGPGTGNLYQTYMQETIALVETLLAE